MSIKALQVFLFTEAPLHAGAGATLSAIDLPIQRETHTQHPVVYASGVKGSLRELAAGPHGVLSKNFEAVFGPESDNASEHGGLGIFSEARVLLFPVASFAGVYQWVTCPMVLQRLKRDMAAMEQFLQPAAATGAKAFQILAIPDLGVQGAAAPGKCSGIIKGKIHLDEGAPLEVETKHNAAAEALAKWFVTYAFPQGEEYSYWRTRAERDIIVAHDEEFTHLVKFATHVELHVKIGSDGTVEQGPWSEESLPPDTLLALSVVLPEAMDKKTREKLGESEPIDLMKSLASGNTRFQMCGGRSLGMGWVALHVTT
jgi:CRISPR-associated protein Cmr4